MAKEHYRINTDSRKRQRRRSWTKTERQQWLRRDYGMTEQEYEALLGQRHGACAICGDPPPGNRKLAVDHCHVTGVVRGLLCWNCNTGLGHFKDSLARLAAAAEYLKRA